MFVIRFKMVYARIFGKTSTGVHLEFSSYFGLAKTMISLHKLRLKLKCFLIACQFVHIRCIAFRFSAATIVLRFIYDLSSRNFEYVFL